MKHFVWVLLAGWLLAGCGGTEQQVVNVYSHRHYDADKQLFAEFEQQTGIKVNVVSADADQILSRIEQEGASSPADVIITADAGRLHRAKQKGLLQAINSEKLNAQVPAFFRDADNQWFALTYRARIIAYAQERVKPAQLSSYEALTAPEWKGKVLVRSSENIYNQSLMAAFLDWMSVEQATAWAAGIVANMAKEPSGNDTDQLKAIAAGTGDVAIVNSYYVGKLLGSEKPEDREIGSKVGVFFPDQSGRGTHINVSGAGIAKNAPNKDNAVRLLEFLTDKAAQTVFAEANFEYPVHPEVGPSKILAAWGTFRFDSVSLDKLGANNSQAVQVFDKAGWK